MNGVVITGYAINTAVGNDKRKIIETILNYKPSVRLLDIYEKIKLNNWIKKLVFLMKRV